MSKELVITKRGTQIVTSLFIEKELIQINCEEERSKNTLGNIYIGKVKNIVKNINAAFVEIKDKQMCFLPLDDCKEPIFINKRKGISIQNGDELFVQISKEGVKSKVPTVTCNLSFSGKYVAITYGKRQIGISNKIRDKKERERLTVLLEEALDVSLGAIARTNAAYAAEGAILNEICHLKELFNNLQSQGVYRSCFSMVYEAPLGYLSNIRDGYSDEIDKIITDNKEIYDVIYWYLDQNQKTDINKLQFYQDEMISLNSLFSIERQIEKALQKKVWLKSGGYLVIEPTEALTVIDVNTGKAIQGRKKAQETFYKINMEAAKEISKQLRLRNLSGIIIVDFIDLEKKEDKQKLIETFRSYLEKDPIKTSYIDMTPLYLVEITRKKVRKPLHEQIQEISINV